MDRCGVKVLAKSCGTCYVDIVSQDGSGPVRYILDKWGNALDNSYFV